MPSVLASAPFGEPVPAGRAADIARGVTRLLGSHAYACLLEVTLANGRRADVMAISPKGDVVIVEIKSGLPDFLSDQKWPDYAPFCDRFYFAVDCDFPRDRIPEEIGLIVADAFGGSILREGPVEKLAGARRKAVTLGFGMLAARRLHRLKDAIDEGGDAETNPRDLPEDMHETRIG